jgi:hypothetical protein
MRITVLVSQTRREEIPRIKHFLDRRYISSSFYIINPNWSLNGEPQLLDLIRDSYDLLILCEQKDLKARWIPYIIGFSQERNCDELRKVGKVFFITERTGPLPLWLKNTALVSNYPKLNDYFEMIKAKWHKMNDVYIASLFLRKLGYDNLHTPIFEGDKDRDLMLLELYIEGGGDPDYIDEDGVPLLCLIMRNDEKKLAYHLLRRGCDVNLIAQDRGTSALMEAASRGYDDLVSLFISLGAHLEHTSKDGQTALILAMGNQHKEAARVLLDAGADGLKLDNLQMNALKYARLYGFTELEKRIEENEE